MAGSNYDAIIAGLVATLKTVAGLKNVLDYEPAAISAGGAPLAYLLLKEVPAIEPATGGEMALRYTIGLRLVLIYTNNETAEQQVRQLVPAILSALGGDLSAGGAIVDGQVLATRATGGYITIASTRCRVVDFTLEAVERVPFTWAL